MKISIALLSLAFLSLPCPAAVAPPEKALKYHTALLKRPDNATLFDRFFGAWLDEQPVESLEQFLIRRAAEKGGGNLAVLARYQLRRGQEEEALDTLAKATAALPEQFSLPLERAKILLRRLDFENARKDLAKVAAGSDEALSLEASKLIGRSFLREGRPEKALETWDALLAAHPGDEDLLEDLVESAAAEGEFDQALAYSDKLIAASSDPYGKTLRQLRRGDLLAQSGKSDEAVEAYSATLAQVGEGSWLEREVLAQIEKVFRKQDRLDDMKAELEKLAEANPRRLLIHRNLAKLEAAQGEIDAAIGRFREVLKRSPGERELREEFIRMLMEGEKLEEAATELEKMIALAPEDAELHLQMSSLRHLQGEEKQTLASLEKARELLGDHEADGLRIAALMLQYGQTEAGEALLGKLSAAEGATTAPAEALASEYARTDRKPQALEILGKIAATGSLEATLRVAGSVATMGESETAFALLAARREEFSSEPRFLSSFAQMALAANKPDEAIPEAVKLVRLSTQASDLGESIGLATRVIIAADEVFKWRETLAAQPETGASEKCLLAALAETQGDFDAVAKIMDGATDPLVLRFHTVLLDRRGQFEKAIATLSRLADTDEGRKASFFKDLTELQQRAGKFEDALETIEQWKQSAPGDKTAWITGSELLRNTGKTDEAVRTIRQAVARFEGDADLTARLASLHEEAGHMEDADALYWRLYENSETPSEQVRWAGQLAKLAFRTGRTAELDEKFRERARGNRRSVGPILAQVELARVTQDEDKRRDLLLEAVRLQPKDVDLRLRIANLEEQSGNSDRAIAILEEAVDTDPSGRVRSTLAQAYLRLGETMKGMRELRALSGKQGNDPRSLERSAAMLAGAGLYEEAIRFLRETLPDGGDWRSKYLLAVMLEQDGRETEALPLFLALHQAQGEIPGLAPPNPANPARNNWLSENLPEKSREILMLTSSVQLAYAHLQDGRSSSFRMGGATTTSQTGPFTLPDTAEDVRRLALVHLAKLSQTGAGASQGIPARVRAAGIDDLDFISELTAPGSSGSPDFPKLLKNYPDKPGLLEIALMLGGYYGQRDGIDNELLTELVGKTDLSPQAEFLARMSLAEGADDDDPAWEALISAAAKCLQSENETTRMTAAYRLLSMLSGELDERKIPGKHAETVKTLLLDFSAETTDEDMDSFRFAVLSVAGTREQWISELNQAISKTRDKPPAAGSAMARQLRQRIAYMSQMGGYNPWMNGNSVFSLPSLEEMTFTTLPTELLIMIGGSENERGRYGPMAVPATELIPLLDRLDSPAARAWIALRANDKKAVAKTLSVTPPKDEEADFNQLAAYRAIQEKEFAKAFGLMEKSRPAYAADRNLSNWLNFRLLGIASEMTAEEREAAAESIRPLLIRSRAVLGTQGAPMLAAKATELGFPDLAERFTPPLQPAVRGASRLGPATLGASPTASSSGPGSLDKLKKFIAGKKHEAAAREALLLYRQMKSSGRYNSYELGQIKEELDPPTIAELVRMTDPGDSKSLTKRMEYADICSDFGKPELALAALSSLRAERPEDSAVAAKLAFLLPPDQRDLACELISEGIASPVFVDLASSYGQSAVSENSKPGNSPYFETVTQWLEGADPAAIKDANLTWVAYHGKNFLTGNYSGNLPNLISDRSSRTTKDESYAAHVALAKRLALAMHRHHSISDEGFRLLSASHAWKLTPAELDEKARRTLLLANVSDGTGNHNSSFFTLRYSSGGGSSSGDSLDANSSVGWLMKRVAEEKSPDSLFPPAYLAELREKQPEVAELVSAVISLSDLAGLEKLWKSGTLKGNSGPFTEMLRQGALARAGKIPGAGRFFLERIREIRPATLNYGRNQEEMSLLTAALAAAGSSDDEILTRICSAVSETIYGKEPDWDKPDQELRQRMYLMGQLLDAESIGATPKIRIYQTLFKLGVPSANNEYRMTQPFRNLKLEDTETAEAFFDSIGWLDGVKTWQPYAAVIADMNQVGGNLSVTLGTKLFNAEVARSSIFDFSQTAMVKHLAEREPKTFGALITAASCSMESERSRLAAEAFALAAPDLADLPPDRVASLSLLLPWLPPEAIAKLPPAFRETMEAEQKEKLEELMKSADAYLADRGGANNPFGNSHDPFDPIQEIVMRLTPLDLDKAVEVFIEAERRFTASLASGGRLSSYTSSGVQITQRDQALSEILQDSDSPLRKDHALALAFHAAVARSEEAGRFAFTTTWGAGPAIYGIGERISGSSDPKKHQGKPRWLHPMFDVSQMPEAVRKDAYAALATYLIGVNRNSSPSNLAKDREELSKMKGLPAEIVALRSLHLGAEAWNNDRPPGRQSTENALLTFVKDQEIQETTRLQLMAITLQEEPRLADNLEIAEILASLFENYAAAERSVINTLGLRIVRLAGRTDNPPQTKPFFDRINKAFWDNANSPKKGGHPAIPPEAGEYLFLAAAIAGDDANAGKLLSGIRPEIEGKLHVISSLIANGKHEMAGQLLAPPHAYYDRSGSSKSVPYDISFEQRMEEFRKTPGLDPLALLRLEAQFKSDGPYPSGPRKPTETEAEREQRLAEAYRKNPPANQQDRIEILSSLTRDSHTAAILLRDEMIALRDELDLPAILEDWHRGSGGNPDLAKRHHSAPAKSVIFRQAAFLEFLEGDLSGLGDLVEVLAKEPEYRKRFVRSGDHGYLESYLERVLESAPIWICEAAHRGMTKGFEDGFEIFREFFIITQKRSELDIDEMYQALAPAEYFAYWSGKGERFKRLNDDLKREQKRLNYFDKPEGIFRIAYNGQKHKTWQQESFSEAKTGFLLHSFTRKEIQAFYPHLQHWLPNSGNRHGLRDELLEIAANPPEDILPTVLPHLLNYRAQHEFEEKQFEKAVATSRAAINACPDKAGWKETRFLWRQSLAEKLFNAKKIEQAKEIYDSIVFENMGKNQTRRHEALGNKIRKALEQ